MDFPIQVKDVGYVCVCIYIYAHIHPHLFYTYQYLYLCGLYIYNQYITYINMYVYMYI